MAAAEPGPAAARDPAEEAGPRAQPAQGTSNPAGTDRAAVPLSLVGTASPASQSMATGPRSSRLVIAVLLAAAVLLASTTTLLVAHQYANRTGFAASALLAVPAPEEAGGFPRNFPPSGNPGLNAAIAQFRRRFSAAMSPRPGAGYLDGFYREPGTVDLATGASGWMMYLGYNAPAGLGPARATVARLMASLLAGPGPAIPWQVPPGRPGGSALCGVTVIARTPVAVCGWATRRTAAAIISPTQDTTAGELAVLMARMRRNLQPA